MRSAVAAIVVVAALASCKKAAGPSPNATTSECEQYRNKMFGFLPDSERESAKSLGMDKPTKLEVDLCMQRMTSEEVRCALKASTQADALACKGSVDIRPPEAKRSPEECKAYSEHVMTLATENEQGGAMGPPFTPAMAAMFARECERWLTKQRFDCVMKAPSPMGLMLCKP